MKNNQVGVHFLFYVPTIETNPLIQTINYRVPEELGHLSTP